MSRIKSGDRFTNPFETRGVKKCALPNIGAHCDRNRLSKCSECVCNKGTETYRADIKKCVSTENMSNFTGCRYKGIKDVFKGLMDTNLPTLNFSKSDDKDIRGLFHISQGEDADKINCEIENTTSFLNSRGEWVPIPDIGDVLIIRAYDGHGTIKRYLGLVWEKVTHSYSGLLIKLHISCRTRFDLPERDCFVFKSTGHQNIDIVSPSTRSILATTGVYTTTDGKMELSTMMATTKANIVSKNYTYAVSMPVIIGVSVGVGLVILVIIILAVCFVRHRTRKYQEAKQQNPNTDAPPVVQFTAQTRFGLIQEAAPVDSENEEYTSLMEKRESYNPYCPLQKDDVDFNVIDTILKDAVSMESMNPSSEPRYSCHLTKDDAIVIETAKPRKPSQSKYHEFGPPDDANEPDYEEVDDEDNPMTSLRLSGAKPPLPEREYHELEPPMARVHSEC